MSFVHEAAFDTDGVSTHSVYWHKAQWMCNIQSKHSAVEYHQLQWIKGAQFFSYSVWIAG